MGFSIQDIKNIFNRPSPSPAKASDNSGTIVLRSDMDEEYSIQNSNWYSAKPYGFKMIQTDGSIFTMFLPISPANLNITTPFATNIIPTLYGTIEEHSDVRYHDIVIEGTTGMAPKFFEPGAGDAMSTLYSTLGKGGRTSTPVASSLSMGGFFSKTMGTLNQALNKASDLINGKPKPKTGLFSEQSGYVAFHNLYRFLLRYKKDASGVIGGGENRQSHPLTFFNYKDNNEYDVVVRSFSLRRDAQNPMLYNYSIVLRGYNLRTISSPISDDLKQRMKDLGLNGVDSSSALGDIKSIASQAKAVLGSLAGGINVLGR